MGDMADKIEDGGAAFPMWLPNHDKWTEFGRGMSLRDYFAAAAMQGIEANPSDCCVDADGEMVAMWAYEIADAMLVERAKVRKPV